MRKYIYVTIRGQTYKVEVDENLDRLLRPILKEKYEYTSDGKLEIDDGDLKTSYKVKQLLISRLLNQMKGLNLPDSLKSKLSDIETYTKSKNNLYNSDLRELENVFLETSQIYSDIRDNKYSNYPKEPESEVTVKTEGEPLEYSTEEKDESENSSTTSKLDEIAEILDEIKEEEVSSSISVPEIKEAISRIVVSKSEEEYRAATNTDSPSVDLDKYIPEASHDKTKRIIIPPSANPEAVALRVVASMCPNKDVGKKVVEAIRTKQEFKSEASKAFDNLRSNLKFYHVSADNLNYFGNSFMEQYQALCRETGVDPEEMFRDYFSNSASKRYNSPLDQFIRLFIKANGGNESLRGVLEATLVKKATAAHLISSRFNNYLSADYRNLNVTSSGHIEYNNVLERREETSFEISETTENVKTTQTIETVNNRQTTGNVSATASVEVPGSTSTEFKTTANINHNSGIPTPTDMNIEYRTDYQNGIASSTPESFDFDKDLSKKADVASINSTEETNIPGYVPTPNNIATPTSHVKGVTKGGGIGSTKQQVGINSAFDGNAAKNLNPNMEQASEQALDINIKLEAESLSAEEQLFKQEHPNVISFSGNAVGNKYKNKFSKLPGHGVIDLNLYSGGKKNHKMNSSLLEDENDEEDSFDFENNEEFDNSDDLNNENTNINNTENKKTKTGNSNKKKGKSQDGNSNLGKTAESGLSNAKDAALDNAKDAAKEKAKEAAKKEIKKKGKQAIIEFAKKNPYVLIAAAVIIGVLILLILLAAFYQQQQENKKNQEFTYHGTFNNGTYWWPIGSADVDEEGLYSGEPVSINITSFFGPRKLDLPGASTNHGAIDIGVVRETPIIATAGGTVTKTVSGCVEGDRQCGGRLGNYVVIDHGNGIETTYGHLTRPTVKEGDTVAKGQMIGASGNTGNSTGPHLHFVFKVNGVKVDPLNYVSPSNPRPQGTGYGNVGSDFIAFLHSWEGSGPGATDTTYMIYDDSTGVLTVGYGVTLIYNADRFKARGIDINNLKEGDRIDRSLVDSIEAEIIEGNIANVKNTVSSCAPDLNTQQIEALVSRKYNTGNISSFCENYTKYKMTQDLYTNYMSKPITSKGKVLKGLIRRRDAEWDLFYKGIYTLNG